MAKIKISFSREADDALVTIAQHITDSMTGNTAFATPAPALEDVQTALATYSDALSKAQAGGSIAVAAKRAAKNALAQLLNKLGTYVQFTAAGDEQTLIGSGFPLNKARTPVGQLPAADNVKATSANIGEVSLSLSPIKGAKSYLWQYQKSTATDGVWLSLPVTKTRASLAGLTSATEYTFKVAGVGANPALTFSKEVKSVVL